MYMYLPSQTLLYLIQANSTPNVAINTKSTLWQLYGL